MAKKNLIKTAETKETSKKERDWKPKFLAALAESGNVGLACRFGSVARATVYRYRNTDVKFAEAWDDAIDEATDSLELELRRRAKDGVEEPVYYLGEVVGHVRKYSDTLLIFYLKAYRPERFRDTSPKQIADEITKRLGDASPTDLGASRDAFKGGGAT